MIDWKVGHHGDRRAVVVEHDAVADLVGRPGATGMLVPMRFPEGDAGPSYTVQSLHDRDALVLALQNSSAPDYEEVFSHRDAGAGSSVWAADGGRTYLRGPLEETVVCFFCTTYVVGSRLCRPRLPHREVVSPGDSAREVMDKALMWLSYGTRPVWAVNPGSRTVDVYRPGERTVTLGVDDALDGLDVLPGFTCPVSDIFDF